MYTSHKANWQSNVPAPAPAAPKLPPNVNPPADRSQEADEFQTPLSAQDQRAWDALQAEHLSLTTQLAAAKEKFGNLGTFAYAERGLLIAEIGRLTGEIGKNESLQKEFWIARQERNEVLQEIIDFVNELPLDPDEPPSQYPIPMSQEQKETWDALQATHLRLVNTRNEQQAELSTLPESSVASLILISSINKLEHKIAKNEEAQRVFLTSIVLDNAFDTAASVLASAPKIDLKLPDLETILADLLPDSQEELDAINLAQVQNRLEEIEALINEGLHGTTEAPPIPLSPAQMETWNYLQTLKAGLTNARKELQAQLDSLPASLNPLKVRLQAEIAKIDQQLQAVEIAQTDFLENCQKANNQEQILILKERLEAIQRLIDSIPEPRSPADEAAHAPDKSADSQNKKRRPRDCA